MTRQELLDLAGGLPGIQVLHDSDLGMVLERTSESGRHAWYAFKAADYQTNDATDVAGVLLGKRPCRIMNKYTRIVGYYSNMAAWNRSKLAEHRDRQRGSYALSEGAIALETHALPADVVQEQLESHADLAVCTLAAD